ncbi:MAG: hypothetical protein FGM16_10760 [Flavobacterium sp.]|nr:hypothetical protein [Flavobacterium sp.]
MSLTKVTYTMIDGAWTNVLDYGADPTGLTDSTTALQNAIDSGAPVYIPMGTYLTDVLTVRTGQGFQFIGAGAGKTIFLEKTANTGILKNPNGVQFNGRIGQFSIKANASSNGTGYGILVSGFYNTIFEQIQYLSNGSGYWESMFNVSASPQLCYGNTINQMEIREQVGPKVGVLFSNGNQGVLYNANACTINDGLIANNTLMVCAINAARSINVTISSMLIERNYTTATITGLQADAALGINAGQATCIIGNYFEQLNPWIQYENPADGGGDNGFVAGNHFSPNWITTTTFFNGAKGNVWVGNDENPLTPINFSGSTGLNWKIGAHDVPANPTITYASGTTGALANTSVVLVNNAASFDLSYKITAEWTPTSSGTNNTSLFNISVPTGYSVKSFSVTGNMPAFNAQPVICATTGSSTAVVSNTQTTAIVIIAYICFSKTTF